jgi:hypothetical protein
MKPKTPTTYVLYVEHDSGPDRVSVHPTAKAAQVALQLYADDVATDCGENWDGLTMRDLLERLVEFNEHARIYACTGTDSQELDPVLLCEFEE